MNERECPKCPEGHGIMDGESLEIPKKIPLPLPTSPTISLEPYLPRLIKQHKYYAIYICRTCGYTEFFVYN